MFNRGFLDLMHRITQVSNDVNSQLVFIKPNGSVLVQSFGFQCSLPPGSVQLPEGSSALVAAVDELLKKTKTAEINLVDFSPVADPPCREDRGYTNLTPLAAPLFKGISKTKWAAQKVNDTFIRLTLQNVLMEVNESGWYFVATDGKLLHARRVSREQTSKKKLQFLIPKPLAVVLSKFGVSNCAIAELQQETFLFFTVNGMAFRIASSVGGFPAWERFVPNAGMSFQLPMGTFTKAAEVIRLCKTLKAQKLRATLKVVDGNLFIAELLVATDVDVENQEWLYDSALLARFVKHWPFTGRMLLASHGKYANLVGFVDDSISMLAGMEDRV
jgi:hypothetical protein